MPFLGDAEPTGEIGRDQKRLSDAAQVDGRSREPVEMRNQVAVDLSEDSGCVVRNRVSERHNVTVPDGERLCPGEPRLVNRRSAFLGVARGPKANASTGDHRRNP